MYDDYLTPTLRQFRDMLVQDVSKRQLVEYAARAEQLLGEIDPAGGYNCATLCGRIADQHVGSFPETTVSGEAVQHDLRRLIEDLSNAANVAAIDAGELVYTLEELSAVLGVSTKTISRWREMGLIARKFVINGRKRVAFLRSSVERFVAKNHARVRRAQRFNQMSNEERDGVIERARAFAEAGMPFSTITRGIARETGRSTETIRYTLKRFDQAHPQQAIFGRTTGELSDEVKQRIYRHYRYGESVQTIATRFSCSAAAVNRAVREVRARRIFELPLEYIYSKEFDKPHAEQTILGPFPAATRKKTVKPPSDLPSYLALLYETPLLTREEEQYMFRKFNYLKYTASRLREQLNPRRPSARLMDWIERLYDEAVETKNQIIQANLRLVVSLAKKRVRPIEPMFELVSDGNMSLIRAVEKFDYSLGNKFSTYATWAILKNFARTIPTETRHQSRFHTGQDEILAVNPDYRDHSASDETEHVQHQRQVNRILKYLDEREQQIIIARYGLDYQHEPQTLVEIGREMGVTKERVRQIEARALKKLVRAAQQEGIELLN